ncbi:MAG: GNAT family N-acetyltransferase [Syntrophaceae bacterium]|nr:GNAT family N-acetyltransferase [Syntrophaceae bacterium]
MPTKTRNKIKSDKFILARLESNKDFKRAIFFDCGVDDLNEFFKEDAIYHKEHLLAETYYFQPIEATKNRLFYPVAFISFLNDHIPITHEEKKVEKKDFWKDIKKHMPYKLSHYNAFPAVKIGRLGVHKDYQRNHIGSYLLNMTKEFFLTHNRTGCRFITVDSYNSEVTISFYQKNGFQFLWNNDKNKDTRIMYFDLKRFKDQSKPILK